jgi:N-carbamoylputrescine amidase
LRISVCELPDNRLEFESAWDNLIQHVRFAESALVVLPELPAATWFGTTPDFDQSRWDAVVAAHERLVDGLSVFGGAIVVTSIAETIDGERHNTAVAWTRETGVVRMHAKTILPEEPGFHEQSWYAAGDVRPAVHEVGGVRVGILLCSELMATDRARWLGNDGAQVICVPRATTDQEYWVVAARMAAIASGAYVLSSNRSGQSAAGEDTFGGRSLIVDPSGAVIGETSRAKPFATAEIDLAAADRAEDRPTPRYLAID